MRRVSVDRGGNVDIYLMLSKPRQSFKPRNIIKTVLFVVVVVVVLLWRV